MVCDILVKETQAMPACGRTICMIRIFSIPGCPLCRKARNWLKEEGLPIENENFYSFLLDDARVLRFAKTYRNWLLLKMKDVPGIQNWKNDQIARFLQQNPSRLPRPVIVADQEPEEINRKLLHHFMSENEPACPASCTIASACRRVRENDRALLILNGRIMRPMDAEQIAAAAKDPQTALHRTPKTVSAEKKVTALAAQPEGTKQEPQKEAETSASNPQTVETEVTIEITE